MSHGTAFVRSLSAECVQDGTGSMPRDPAPRPEVPGEAVLTPILCSCLGWGGTQMCSHYGGLLPEQEQRGPSHLMSEEACSFLQASLPICPEFDPPLQGFGRLRSPRMLSFSAKAHCTLYMVTCDFFTLSRR